MRPYILSAIAGTLVLAGTALTPTTAAAHPPGSGHSRYHDELRHREVHRRLEHREAHRYPMTWWEHERLHDALRHERFHDRLEHREWHRRYDYHAPYGGYRGYPWRGYGPRY